MKRREFVAGGFSAAFAAGALPKELHQMNSNLGPPLNKYKSVSTPNAYLSPREKLKKFSQNAHQLWPVIYVDPTNLIENLERDIEAAFEGGADAVVIELGKNPATLARAVEHARAKYPHAVLGVNYLGSAGDEDPYGFINGFQLVKDHDLQIVWTDFSGVDLIQELPEISQQTIEKQRPLEAFYCSGIHMKYGTLLDPNKPIEKSALQALGWVDGLIVTGTQTGIPTDPEKARRARAVIGDYPLGAASGVTAQNVQYLLPYIDYCLVNTSISDPNHRLIKAKVKELREKMR